MSVLLPLEATDPGTVTDASWLRLRAEARGAEETDHLRRTEEEEAGHLVHSHQASLRGALPCAGPPSPCPLATKHCFHPCGPDDLGGMRRETPDSRAGGREEGWSHAGKEGGSGVRGPLCSAGQGGNRGPGIVHWRRRGVRVCPHHGSSSGKIPDCYLLSSSPKSRGPNVPICPSTGGAGPQRRTRGQSHRRDGARPLASARSAGQPGPRAPGAPARPAGSAEMRHSPYFPCTLAQLPRETYSPV